MSVVFFTRDHDKLGVVLSRPPSHPWDISGSKPDRCIRTSGSQGVFMTGSRLRSPWYLVTPHVTTNTASV